MELRGKISEILEERHITDKFVIKEFIITFASGGSYDEHILMQTANRTLTLLEGFSVGEDVVVTFDIKGRKDKTGRVWNTLSVQKIDRVGEAVVIKKKVPRSVHKSADCNGDFVEDVLPILPVDDGNNDLPF